MLQKEITFDRFIRGLIVVAILLLAGWLITRLSTVLLPFFIAWLLAYLLYPMVRFLQYRCKLRNRVVSILVALLLVIGGVVGILAIVLPPAIQEFARLSDLITFYLNDFLGNTKITEQIVGFIKPYTRMSIPSIMEALQQNNVMGTLGSVISQAWVLLTGTINVAIGILGSFIVLLYFFFILMDYESISSGWIRLFPVSQRALAVQVAQDVSNGMNAYFRGQALIAFCVGILFSIGFLIIDFPLGVVLGLFIGFLNLVPYMQVIGFLPTILLAFIKSAETGQNFWFILLCAAAVFCVVQVIQDMVLTPRIMGRAMGLNPAIILLSLSIWGSLLGIIGLIIALPLTTLLLSYYHRFVLKETENMNEKTAH